MYSAAVGIEVPLAICKNVVARGIIMITCATVLYYLLPAVDGFARERRFANNIADDSYGDAVLYPIHQRHKHCTVALR